MKLPKMKNPLFALTLGVVSCGAFAQTPAPTGGSAEKAPEWSESDSNRDGFLTKDELVSFPGVLKQFAEIDTDSDGKISEMEYKHWRHPARH